MQLLRTVLLTGIFTLCSLASTAIASSESLSVLPSFTADATEGFQNSGFVVQFTNTSLAIDESCGTLVSYSWFIDNGAEGVDWLYVNGTNATTEHLAVEFITEGCYNVELSATDCSGSATSTTTINSEITIAGIPEIFVDDFSTVSYCSNGDAQAFWEIAPHNNNLIDFNVYLNGQPIDSDNLTTLSFCTDPSNIYFADVVALGQLDPGDYTLVFEAMGDVSGSLPPTNIAYEVITFSVNEAPELTVSSTALSYCSSDQATVDASPTLGNPPYVASWNINGLLQHSEVINDGNTSSYDFDLTGYNGPTTLSVEITDQNGCVTTETIEIEVFDDVNFTVTTEPTCENSAATFTATGNAQQYIWPDALFTVTNPVTAVGGEDTQSAIMGNGIAVDVTGEIIYTDISGFNITCSSTATANAIVNPNPVISVSPANASTFCADESPVVTATGADTYTWSPAPVSNAGGVATYAAGLPSPLTGTVTGSIDYGGGYSCESSALFNYEILDAPVVNLSTADNIVCGPVADVVVTTGGMDEFIYSFDWALNGSPLNGEVANNVNFPLNYPDDAGINTVECQVTHINGCVGSNSIEIELLEGAELSLNAPIICDGEPFYIDVVANGTVTWDTNGATPFADGYYYDPAPDGTTYTATALVTSVSEITSGQFGCSVSESVTVETRANPDLEFVFSGTPCTGQSVQIDINGAQTYTWNSNPSETGDSSTPDGANPGLNILSLAYTNAVPGDINVDVTGSIEYTDAANLVCSTTESFTQTINSNTSFQLTGDTEICEGECINLDIEWDEDPNGATFSYDWFLDGMLHSNGNTFTECPTYASGVAEVQLIVEAGNNCQSSQIIFVNTSQLPVITATADVNEGCNPLTVNFTATNQFASVTAWNYDNGQSDTGVDNTQMTFDCLDYDNGDCVYLVNYTAISPTNPNCTATEIIPITVHPIPVSDFYLQETVACYDAANDVVINAVNNSSELLGQNCAGGNTPYNWTLFPTGAGDCTETVDETPTLTVSDTGDFTVGLEVVDQYGCSSQSFQDFLVAEAPTPEIGFFQTSVCLPTQIEVLNTTTGAASFELEVPGFVIPTNFNSPFYLDVEYPGVYEAEFTVTSIEGCSVTLEIEDAFEAWYPPVSDFTTNPEVIDILDPVVNFVNLTEGGTAFIWSFGDGDGASEVNPTHEYLMSGEYDVQLHVTNEHGCTDVSTQTINVNNLLQIFVPNSFTPNNDGNNDAWFPVISGQELIAKYECWVFDRWGRMVYFSTTPGEPWVGDSSVFGEGTHYTSGTEAYSWRIEIKMVDGLGARIETGHLYLVR